MNNLKIDLVYLWVNNNDTEWKNKKAKYEKLQANKTLLSDDSNADCRYIDNQELKYSLRSVEKYAPWINHIFIVTDNQVPNWLNTKNPKISIVDHKEIIPEDALPTFNSISIENCICNIKNLSEFFLYANDDMFINAEITPAFFYDKNFYPICRFHRKPKEQRKSLYFKLIYNAQDLIYKRYKVRYNYTPHHSIDAYRKSDFKKFQEIFKDEVNLCINSRFRNENNFERIAYLYYMCAIKHGRAKIIKKVDLDLNPFTRIKNYITKKYSKDSIYISCDCEDPLLYIKEFTPKLFCLNDTEFVTDSDRERCKNLLENLYPEKSEYEL